MNDTCHLPSRSLSFSIEKVYLWVSWAERKVECVNSGFWSLKGFLKSMCDISTKIRICSPRWRCHRVIPVSANENPCHGASLFCIGYWKYWVCSCKEEKVGVKIRMIWLSSIEDRTYLLHCVVYYFLIFVLKAVELPSLFSIQYLMFKRLSNWLWLFHLSFWIRCSPQLRC